MTSIFCCGGECGRLAANGANVGEHWTRSVAGTHTIETTTVHAGARALRIATSGTNGTLTANLTTATRWIGRVYVRFMTSLPSATTTILATSSGGPNVRFQQSDSTLYASVSSTLGASGVAVTTGQWYRIDFDFNINTGGNDTCDVQVDGTACGQATATGASGALPFNLGMQDGAPTADVIFDNIVLSQTAADYPIGAGNVYHFVPTADGTHNVAGANDFERGDTGTDITNATTNAFELVNDVPLDDTTPDTDDSIAAVAPPNATDYVELVFGPAPGVSTPTTGPRAVEVILGAHQDGTGTGNYRLALNDNGTLNDVANLTRAGVTTIRYERKHYADPPSAASVWHANNDGSDGDFRDLRCRFFSSDAAPNQYLDCIMIEAEFADVAVQYAPAMFLPLGILQRAHPR